MNLCGNNSFDSKFVIQLKDPVHAASSLDFAIHLNRMGKIGISNIQLYLLGATVSSSPPFEL